MSSVGDEGRNENCSSSRNGEISNTDGLKKFKKHNVGIRDFKIMLVNGLSKVKKDGCLTAELKKDGKLPASCDDTTSTDKDKTSVRSDKSSLKSDPFPVNTDLVDEIAPIETEYEIDDKGSIDENSFELRIDNDDEEEISIKFDPDSSLDSKNAKECDIVARSANAVEKHSLQTGAPTSSEKVFSRNYSSTDLENITIPDTISNKDEVPVKKVTPSAPRPMPPKAPISPVKNAQTTFNCAFCEKTFPNKNSLKFHVLSHLKTFLRQDRKEGPLDVTAELGKAPAENADGTSSADFVCVLCEKSFTNKITLTVHYKVHHQADSQKVPSQNHNRRLSTASTPSLNGVRSSSDENKAADTPINVAAVTASPMGSSTTEENSANADENGSNEDASKQYKCYICDKQFARNSSLMWHIQFHETYMYSKLKKNNSELENGLSPGGSGVTADTLPIDADHPFRCQVCGKTYESLSGYRRHVVNHGVLDDDESGVATVANGGSGEKCELCNKYYPTSLRLKRHIISMHKDQLPQSAVEDMEAAVDAPVDEGEGSIGGSSVSEEFECNVCERTFSNHSTYRRHMHLVHKMTGDETLTSLQQQSPRVKCDACGSFFSTSSNMKKHAQKHCRARLTTQVNLEEDDDDDDNVSKGSTEEFECDICHRIFCSQRAANIHRAHQHRGKLSESVASDPVESDVNTPVTDMIPIDSYVERDEGDFQCTVCDKTFESRKGVIRHIGYHRSALNAQIDASNATGESSDSDNDSNDDNSDDTDDGIPCSVCGKMFESVRGMRIHANSHREQLANSDDDDDDADDGDTVAESAYDCDICHETFDGFRSFKVHMGWHSRRGEEAGAPHKKSSSKSNNSRPIQPPSGVGKIHQCQHCPRWYNTQQALAGHMKAHQPAKTGTPQGSEQSRPPASGGKTSKTYMCQICGQHFPSGMGLGGHMKLHGSDCVPVVSTPTTSSGQPLTLEDTMECDICGKFFMRKQDMAKHMRDHISGAITKENVDLSLFRCIYCQKSFVGRKSLNTHQMLHEEAPVTLKRPADQSTVGASSAKHRRLSESATAAAQEDLAGWDDMLPVNQCEECDRRLSTKQSLRRHMEWHARMKTASGASASSVNEAEAAAVTAVPLVQRQVVETPFECLYCKKCFSTKELLVQHTSIHEDVTGEGPPTVVVNDVEALGEHAVVQCVEGGNEEYFVFEQREGEAYQCSECDETHFDKLQMIVHMAFHVGRRWANGHQRSLIIKADPIMLAPHECMFCDERFVNKTYRSRHLLKRHGDDVLQCDSCKKLFLSKKKLAVHCQRHITDSMYRCEHCLKCFTSKWFLKRHERKKCAGKSSPEKKEMKLPNGGAALPEPPLSPSLVPQDYKCDFCGFLVDDRARFLAHLQSHVLKYKCQNCDFGCENILELESHACIVTTTESVPCGQCDDVFTDAAQLDSHRRSCHQGGSAATLLCDVCSELFEREDDLQRHRRKKHRPATSSKDGR